MTDTSLADSVSGDDVGYRRAVEASEVAAAVAAAVDGDEAAWRRLVDQFNPMLWWIARSYRLDPDSSGDLVQTVWVLFLRHAATLAEPGRAGSWLSTTARREALSRQRSAGRSAGRSEPFSDRTASLVSSSDDPLDQLIRDESKGELLYAFARLEGECQKLLRLVVASPPIPYTEIAARLGRPSGAIGPTRQRCLKRLRELLPSSAFPGGERP